MLDEKVMKEVEKLAESGRLGQEAAAAVMEKRRAEDRERQAQEDQEYWKPRLAIVQSIVPEALHPFITVPWRERLRFDASHSIRLELPGYVPIYIRVAGHSCEFALVSARLVCDDDGVWFVWKDPGTRIVWEAHEIVESLDMAMYTCLLYTLDADNLELEAVEKNRSAVRTVEEPDAKRDLALANGLNFDAMLKRAKGLLDDGETNEAIACSLFLIAASIVRGMDDQS